MRAGFHAFSALYLVNAHGKDNKLYPTEPKARAIVDQRMYFDMGNFYDKFGQCVVRNCPFIKLCLRSH